ncbi:hypothetical protein [Mycobacterium sp. E735]|uniref:hypothetical protein n=1 Tax=Mycobacterium sp. E735 TaxID=1834148 RepID=UPI0035134EDA
MNEAPHQPDSADEPANAHEATADDELEPFDDGAEPEADQTGQTDAYSRAYSAPESEHFISGPYLPADLRLYDYDTFDESDEAEDEHAAPRWPWVVGVAAIVAAIALVVSVSLLFARTDTTKLANPNTTTSGEMVSSPRRYAEYLLTISSSSAVRRWCSTRGPFRRSS